MNKRQKKKYQEYIDRYYNSYYMMESVYNEWAQAHGKLTTTLFIVDDISREGSCTQKSLQEHLGYSKQTISAALSKLEEDGIIEKKKDQNDRRNNLIHLTEKGMQVAQPLLSRLRAAEMKAFQEWSDEETEQILAAYQKLSATLDRYLREDMKG